VPFELFAVRDADIEIVLLTRVLFLICNDCFTDKVNSLVVFVSQRHSIHGMMEEENVVRPHQEMKTLSLDEKKFLLAVERGDVATTRRLANQKHLLPLRGRRKRGFAAGGGSSGSSPPIGWREI